MHPHCLWKRLLASWQRVVLATCDIVGGSSAVVHWRSGGACGHGRAGPTRGPVAELVGLDALANQIKFRVGKLYDMDDFRNLSSHWAVFASLTTRPHSCPAGQPLTRRRN